MMGPLARQQRVARKKTISTERLQLLNMNDGSRTDGIVIISRESQNKNNKH